MTDSYRATPPPAPPDRESAGATAPLPPPPAPLPPAPPPIAVAEPEELTLDTLPKRSIDDPNDSASDEREIDRQVWRPPLPQYPPRPERQAPVQYEAPRVQAPPQYTQQQYTPPQPPAAPQPQPQAYTQMQPQPSYAATAPVTYMPPRPAMVIAPPAPRVSKARMGRRMARRAVMGVSSAGKVIFGVRPGLMVAFLLLLVFSGWLAYGKWFSSSSSSTSATPNSPNAPNASGMIALPPEVPAVQSYLTATGKDDPDGVWDTLAPAEKANRITNGEDKTVLAAVLDAEKQYNFTTKYRYVGGLGMNGSSDLSHGGYYFYVQDVVSGTQQHSFPMYFSVDDQGKITVVSDQLYKLILQQLKGGN
jgi:hypothetical protein